MPVFNHIPRLEDDMQGATMENEGKAGLVPAPEAGETDRALMADGRWVRVFTMGDMLSCEDGSLIVGEDNTINNDIHDCSHASLINGHNNTLKNAFDSFVSGRYNTLSSIATGQGNFIFGYNNTVSCSMESSLYGCGALGYLLELIYNDDEDRLNPNMGVVVVGNLNEFRTNSMFEVGSGFYASNNEGVSRRTIFRCAENGDSYVWKNLYVGTMDENELKSYLKASDKRFEAYAVENGKLVPVAIQFGESIEVDKKVSSRQVAASLEVCGKYRVAAGCTSTDEIVKQSRMGSNVINAYTPNSTEDKLVPSEFRIGGNVSASDKVEAGITEAKLSTCCVTRDNSDAPTLTPITNKKSSLGSSNYLWKQLYASTTTIATSDRNLKKDVNPFSEKYEKLFFDLQPSTFKFKDGESNRTHTGFISQDVEEALEKDGLSALDFAGFCKDQKTEIVIDENGKEKEIPVEGEYLYSLRYEEFIALNTHMIQKLYAQVEELQKEVESLKGEILCLQKQ